MGRLAGFTYQDAVRVAQFAGWRFVRARGSHMMYTRPGARRPLVVPSHGEMREGTLHTLVKEMGLTVDEFLELVRR